MQAIAFLAFLAADTDDVAAKKAIALLEGKWKVTVMESKGKKLTGKDIPIDGVVFGGKWFDSQIRWRPDPIFMLDIGESEGRLWLVELNVFSCSWLYRCDLPEVVATAATIAEREWQQGHSDSG